MPDTQIIYVAGYGLKKNTGRNKATREKAAALKTILGEQNFKLYSPASPGNKLAKYLCMLFFDLYLLPGMLFIDKKTIVIQRQAFLPITNVSLWLRGVSIVCEVHGDPMGEIRFLQKSRPEKLMLRILAVVERLTWRMASAMIYINPLFKQQMDAMLRKPSISVYNGCDPEAFTIMDTAACREALGLDTAAKYFLMIGTIARWRGVDLLIDIFKQSLLKDYYLLIVGIAEDNYSRQIVEKAKGQANILFKGYTDIRTAIQYINASDVCLVPVNDILSAPGNPLKLYDYIACGKPVATQAGVMGYSDEVEKYGLGCLTDFRDPTAAARDLVLFINAADVNSYRVKNRQVSIEEVSWKSRMREWIRFIEKHVH